MLIRIALRALMTVFLELSIGITRQLSVHSLMLEFLVTSFVLDYMHMVILGVVRRLLIYMTRGPKLCPLSLRQKHAISQSLIALRGKLPSEFARQPRDLLEVDR